MAEIKIDENAFIVFDQDKTDGISSVISSRTTRQNLACPSLIQRPRI